MEPGRRSFLRGALLTEEGRERTVRHSKPLGPLPPGMAGALAQDGCRACERYCVSACTQRIVYIHPEDHRLAGLPYLDFTQAGCTFCGDCSAACPVDIPAISSTQRLGSARLNQVECLAWNSIICMSCIGACRLGALSMDRQRRPTMDADHCTGCGFCVARCPVQALEVELTGD
jgi:ferredoxin-type protein NapF